MTPGSLATNGRHAARATGAVAALLALCALGTARAADEPIPIKLWFRGHSSLSQQFNVAVEQSFRRSTVFHLIDAVDSSPHRSVLVRLDRFDMERHFTYVAEIYADEIGTSPLLTSFAGRCDVEQIPACGDEVLRILAEKIGAR